MTGHERNVRSISSVTNSDFTPNPYFQGKIWYHVTQRWVTAVGGAHLAATFAAGLVAVEVEALLCLTVTGSARLVTPPASGTRQVGPGNRRIRLHNMPTMTNTHTHTHKV